jgi:hypothetical protein
MSVYSKAMAVGWLVGSVALVLGILIEGLIR